MVEREILSMTRILIRCRLEILAKLTKEKVGCKKRHVEEVHLHCKSGWLNARSPISREKRDTLRARPAN